MLACGNCVYFAMSASFPPTASWCVILPVWLMLLSFLKLNRRLFMRGVPQWWITVPIVLLTCLMAPAILGPLLGLWIPVCIVIGTVTACRHETHSHLRQMIHVVTLTGIIALVMGGVWDIFLTESPVARPQHFTVTSAAQSYLPSVR